MSLGGSVKRSLAMVSWLFKETIAKAFGLDTATHQFQVAWARVPMNTGKMPVLRF